MKFLGSYEGTLQVKNRVIHHDESLVHPFSCLNQQILNSELKLRALRSSGDWQDYWRFHEQREAARNYADAA